MRSFNPRFHLSRSVFLEPGPPSREALFRATQGAQGSLLMAEHLLTEMEMPSLARQVRMARELLEAVHFEARRVLRERRGFIPAEERSRKDRDAD